MCCTRLRRVAEILPAADADAARWLLLPDVDWWDLVRYGPPGFDVYVRVAFRHDSETDVVYSSGESAVDAVRAALATLASCTTTPDRGYAAIWEGWMSGASTPQAPRVEIPNRTMLLLPALARRTDLRGDDRGLDVVLGRGCGAADLLCAPWLREVVHDPPKQPWGHAGHLLQIPTKRDDEQLGITVRGQRQKRALRRHVNSRPARSVTNGLAPVLLVWKR